jgi:hypothetical protein
MSRSSNNSQEIKNLIHTLHMKTSIFKFCGGLTMQRKNYRSLFGVSHNLSHGINPLPLP